MRPPGIVPTLAAILLVVVAAGVAVATPAQAAYVPKTPPLSTPWTGQVSPTDPLPEYPRPQLTRPDWQSLNGQWQFAGTGSLTTPPVDQELAETVLVPYPVESALSGIMRHENRMWYRRTFTVPSGWRGRRVQLNFGAVTYQATVWVNGQQVGTHSGGYDAFSFDVTGALNGGTNEVVVGVYSPVDAAGIPLGKQRLNPSGIFYTAASGIWQSVWLEPTPAARITRLDTTPDVAAGQLDLVVQTAGSAQGVLAEVLSGGTVVGTATGAPGAHLRVPVPNARLWSPDDPFLYDLRVTLTDTGGGDVVGGYFGMRSIAKAVVNGFLRPVLNGRFVFQIGTLDQGYWPDGIYTAPTDAALRFDLEQQKNLGFNLVRKHIKVEPARWFYWADRLGLMVWQDMPAMTGFMPSTLDRATFESELRRMVDQHKGITSIVQWVPFNEGWGEYDAGRIADLVRSWDPTRLVDANSGSNCCGSDPGNGDVVDDHIYVGPGLPQAPSASRVAVLGEFGGIGLRVAGHEWNPCAACAYEMTPDAGRLTQRYVEVTDTLQGLIRDRGLSASVYTEPTDVENEFNGLSTYDRQVLKMNAAQVRAANLAVRAAADGLRAGGLVALEATTACCTERYVRTSATLGVTAPVSAGSDDASKLDATYYARPGLADAACWSFESRADPGQFLRHSGYRLRRDANDGGALFANDATFCARAGHTAKGISFESKNFPGRFLRHVDSQVYIAANGGPNPWDTPAAWADDTTWQVAAPWWRSTAPLAVDQALSLRVVTACCTDRYLRHQGGVAVTSVVTAASDVTTRQDATFVLRHGLASGGCYSLESRTFPGSFLRHSQFRVRLDANDGSAGFARDATFCARPGAGGSGVTLDSYNLADHAVRHYASEVWIAANGGPNAWEPADSYAADVSWAPSPPWD